MSTSIDVAEELIGFNGERLILAPPADGKEPEYWTFRSAVITALRAPKEGMDASAKYETERLLHKLHSKNSVVMKSEQVTLIKERVGELMPPEILGPVFRLLEPDIYTEDE